MNIKKPDFYRNRKYFVAIGIVMLVNIALGVFLIHNVFAQKTNVDLTNQLPVKVEVESQKDSPLVVTVLSVETSGELFQNINYTIQNVDRKPIRAYTLVGRKKVGGKIMTRSFMVKLFQPQQVNIAQFEEERANIKEDTKITLSIDYVEFADGSSWGKDEYQTSEQITQEFAGREAAIDYFKRLIENNEQSSLSNELEQNIVDYQVPIPDRQMNEKAQRGFRTGYKSILSVLQENKNQSNELLLKKLQELEQAIGKEVKKQ